MSVKPAKKVNRKPSGEPAPKGPRSSGKLPDKSPHWVSLDALCQAWVIGEQHRTGKVDLIKKYVARQKDRVRTSTYESACWGALRDCGLQDAARNLQVMVLDQKLPLRFATGRHEIYLGFIDTIEDAVARAAKTVAAGNAGIDAVRAKAGLAALRDVNAGVLKVFAKVSAPDAIAAPRQRVNAKDARVEAKSKKAPPSRAAARIAPKRRPTRG